MFVMSLPLRFPHMFDNTSIAARFIVSVAANAARALLAFVSGMIVARGLSPAGFGDFTFLLGSFVAVRSLLDMGSSNAFYTFISQQHRGRRFYVAYCFWLLLQFVLIVLIVGLIMPDALLDRVWLGHSRPVVLLAFVASFLQQQVWQTVSQIGEAARKTVQVQLLGVMVALVHLLIVILFAQLKMLSVAFMFMLICVEYLTAAIGSIWLLPDGEGALAEDGQHSLPWGQMFDEYWGYCKPLVFLSLFTFFFEFADRWLLQRFGGATQQGFYQIANQFSAISLLATASILNVFWKEAAEANKRGDLELLARLFRRVSRSLLMCGAVMSGFLIPWTDQIVRLFLGEAYLLAAPVLLIMFLFPVHQSMGQICGTMLLASGHTRTYMVISMIFMAVSLPLTYLLQAPPSGIVVAGFGMGAIGMAFKMVLLNIISVNVQAWVIARYRNWRFDWLYQVVGISLVLCSGYCCRLFTGLFWDINSALTPAKLVLPVMVSAVLYAGTIVCLLWMMPWLLGIQRQEIGSLLVKIGALKESGGVL